MQNDVRIGGSIFSPLKLGTRASVRHRTSVDHLMPDDASLTLRHEFRVSTGRCSEASFRGAEGAVAPPPKEIEKKEKRKKKRKKRKKRKKTKKIKKGTI